MNYSIKLMLKIANIVFPVILNQVTPALREELEKALKELYKKAEATENPFDDLLIIFIMEILGFTKDKGQTP